MWISSRMAFAIALSVLLSAASVSGILAIWAMRSTSNNQFDLDMQRLSVDVRLIRGATLPIVGRVAEVRSFDLEPGFTRYLIRKSDGSKLDVVLNRTSRITWPGSNEETVVSGRYGEVDPPPLTAEDLYGLRLVGRYRNERIGSFLFGETQAFLVNGRFEGGHA